MKMMQSFLPRPDGDTMEAHTLNMLLFYALGFCFGPDGVTHYGGFGIYGITGDDKVTSLLVSVCIPGCESVENFIAAGREFMRCECTDMSQSNGHHVPFTELCLTFLSDPTQRNGNAMGRVTRLFPAGRVRTADPHLSRPSRI
jgi:hypothetical protein